MKSALVLLAAAILAGCGGGGQSTSGTPASGGELKAIEADFRPSDHDPLTAATPAPGDPLVRPGIVTARGDSGAATDEELIQGYRVQIYSTANIDAARQKKGEAEGYFPGEFFYLEYDPPAYKIRAGNFRERYEADRFVKLAAERGFSDSWAVPEKVFRHPKR
jgi:hypothetical protein